MTALQRRQAALALLARTGIWPSNYAPPLFHLLWRMGINVPPPHFIGSGYIVIVGGGFFGALMTLLTRPMMPMSLGGTLLQAAVAGLAFGLFMAGYYAYGRSRHRLPRWHALVPAEDADP
jgi:membrane associated rhomboid family serine protease